MRQVSRLIVAGLAVLSLALSTAVIPATSSQAASIGISTKKKVITAEQAKARNSVKSAKAIVKSKTKSLNSANKALARAQAKLTKAEAAVNAAKIRAVQSASKTNKAKVRSATSTYKSALKSFTNAQSLVAKRIAALEASQLKLDRAEAKLKILVTDWSTLNCGLGTQYPLAGGAAIETAWECGIVYNIEDGDTVHVITTTNTIVEARLIGLQTPEEKKGSYKAQCGANEASANMEAMLIPGETIVQLRGQIKRDNTWGGQVRPERSIYKLNPVTGMFDIDVQAEQIKAGWSFQFSSGYGYNWGHNADYITYLRDAQLNQRGIWNPALCGTPVGGTPNIWMNADAPSISGDGEPPFGEYVLLQNSTNTPMDISGWSIRDNSLDFFYKNGWEYSKSKFPTGTVIAPQSFMTVYISKHKDPVTLAPNEYVFLNWRSPENLLLNPDASISKSEGIYLLDQKGNVRNSWIDICSVGTLCATPSWVTDLQATSSTRFIPVPVAFNKVRFPDTYNPSVENAANGNASTTKSNLAAKFLVADGTARDSALAAGKTVAVTTDNGSGNVLGSRVSIADSLGTTRTTLYVHPATGLNTVPNLLGLSQDSAIAALELAGFTVGTITPNGSSGTWLVTSQVESGRLAVGTPISFSVTAQ